MITTLPRTDAPLTLDSKEAFVVSVLEASNNNVVYGIRLVYADTPEEVFEYLKTQGLYTTSCVTLKALLEEGICL